MTTPRGTRPTTLIGLDCAVDRRREGWIRVRRR